ncbi:MAG: MDR family MFS transporter [Ktedonobacterales bacterium]
MESSPRTATPRGGVVAPNEPTHLSGTALAAVLIALMLSLLLAALDQTIVSTALPTIIDDLHGYDRYTWVVTAYLLAETTVIPVIGKLSDQFGRKWFIVAGVVIFIIGSALSGTSQTMNALIIFRGVQGIGAGFLFSQIFTVIGDIFTPAERARWQGLFSGVFGLASVIGPTLGGWITDNTSWRWVFYVNVPLAIIAVIMLVMYLPNSISVRSAYRGAAAFRRIDYWGALTAAGGTISLLLGLTWGGVTYPWNSWQVIGALAIAVTLFVVFFLVERFHAIEPILPLELFKNQIFAAGALLSLFVGMALFAVVIYLPLFIQGVLGESATNSGAVITPLTLTLAIGAALVGQVIAKLGRYQIISIIGAVIMTFGVFLLARMNASTQLGTVTLSMIVVGLGLGMLQPVLTLAVQNAIPRNRLGVGTSAVTYLRTMGQTLGTAIIGTVVSNAAASELAARLATIGKTNPLYHQLPASVIAAATNQQVLTSKPAKTGLTDAVTHAVVQQATANVPPGPAHVQTVATITQMVTEQVHTLLAQLFEATRQSLAVGIQRGFASGLIICVLVIIVTFFLKDAPLRTSFEMPSVPGTPHATPDTATVTEQALSPTPLPWGAGDTRRAEPDPHHLASRVALADGQYVHAPSEEERRRGAVLRERDAAQPDGSNDGNANADDGGRPLELSDGR